MAGSRHHVVPDSVRALLHDDFRRTSHAGEAFSRSEYVRRNTEGDVGWRSQHGSGAGVVVVGTQQSCTPR